MILEFPKGVGEHASPTSDRPHTVEELELHMARELHDRVAQPLISLLLDVSDLRRRRISHEAMADQLLTIEESVRQVLKQTREMMLDLRGQGGLRLNFVQAVQEELHQREGKNQPQTAVRASAWWPREINGWAAFNLLRIVQEALTNASRHGHAKNVEIVLDAAATGIATLQVIDDGRGIDRAAHGFGMAGMIERATILGGTIEVTLSPGGGNVVGVRVPLSRLN